MSLISFGSPGIRVLTPLFVKHDFRLNKKVVHLNDTESYPKQLSEVYARFSTVSTDFRGAKQDSLDPAKGRRFRLVL
jgi:hypothetical protein